jgi:mono/diheme cytochrome c family protein
MKHTSRRARQEALRRQKQKQRIIWGMGIVGVLLLAVSAVMALRSQSVPVANPADSEAVALGRQVYEVQCASCHGVNLEGQANWQEPNPDGSFRAPPHDETGHTWHHNDAYLVESIKLGGGRLLADQGVSAMPSYENVLSDEEISAVLDYIKSSWPSDIRLAQTQR